MVFLIIAVAGGAGAGAFYALRKPAEVASKRYVCVSMEKAAMVCDHTMVVLIQVHFYIKSPVTVQPLTFS